MYRPYMRNPQCGSSPSLCRMTRQPSQSRNMSLFPAAPFFARPNHQRGWHQPSQPQNPFEAALSPFANTYNTAFPFPSFPGGAVAGDLDQLFRILGSDQPSAASTQGDNAAADRQGDVITRHTHRTYSPSFDVRETDEGYHLAGDLPGVDNKDVDVRFVDARTLRVSGKTESENTTARDANGNVVQDAAAPSAATQDEGAAEVQAGQARTESVEAAQEKEDDAQSVRSTSSTASYVKPTVEDEVDEDGGVATTSATPAAPGASDADAANEASTEQPLQRQAARDGKQQPRYWISERTTGSFERKFRFPGRVDQDGVTASLKNGVLSISVPKVKQVEGELRKISVE